MESKVVIKGLDLLIALLTIAAGSAAVFLPIIASDTNAIRKTAESSYRLQVEQWHEQQLLRVNLESAAEDCANAAAPDEAHEDTL